jgi:ABC-2 type transport system permease protein
VSILANTNHNEQKVGVIDRSGIFDELNNKQGDLLVFEKYPQDQWANAKTNYQDKYDLLLQIDSSDQSTQPFDINIYSESSMSNAAYQSLKTQMNTMYRDRLLLEAGIDKEKLDSMRSVELEIKNVTKDSQKSSSVIASGIGMGFAFILYLVLMIYGMMVMRGVMLEKTNRIAEVIISSVRPFELMMGKVIGIALVGLTQFIIWILFIVILASVLTIFIQGRLPANSQGAELPMNEIQSQLQLLKTLPWTTISLSFILFFIGGYLMYASLFAAVGSLVDEDVQESQSLIFPITMPIILGFIIATNAAQDPNSTMAVVGSIFPLTSPIVMMSRIAYNPPMWQVILSLGLLILSFLGMIWVAGKIYRTGILMYGKKVTLKEAWRWLFQKG